MSKIKMVENDDARIIVVEDENGNNIEGEILFTTESNGDNYVLYSIEDTAYAAKIDESNKLSAIEEDEWDLIEKIYNEYMESVDDGIEEDE